MELVFTSSNFFQFFLSFQKEREKNFVSLSPAWNYSDFFKLKSLKNSFRRSTCWKFHLLYTITQEYIVNCSQRTSRIHQTN